MTNTQFDSQDRLKVLILADTCNPEWPSLPIVGYKYAKAIANYADVVVVTQIRNKPNIERYGIGNANVIYIDTEKVAAPIYKLATALRGGTGKGWTMQMAMDYPSYLAFEWFTWRKFRKELFQGEFDLVHRITPMTPTLPSFIAKDCPVPFLLGPLNGNLPWPRQFTAELKREKEWLSRFRDFYKLLPFYRSTYHNSSAILAAFDHTVSDIIESVKPVTINFPEVGIDPEVFSNSKRQLKSKFTVLYVGRLVPYKLPEVVIRSFAASPILQEHKLKIVGEGPERSRLEKIISEHNLSNCVELTGQKKQSEVSDLMHQAEIFAFPSIRELGAGVVVEAMACGMACVVVDYGGPATLIDSDRGVKVAMGNLEELTQRFRKEMEELVSNPDRTTKLGEKAHDHAMAYYTWDAKAKKTLDIYHWVLDKKLEKPSFGSSL
jgi:glycosyltransferase involved in cell wall biosynthesis